MKILGAAAALALAALMTVAAVDAKASLVPFDVTPISFDLGSGYGTGLGKLNVAFDVTGTRQQFQLANAGDSDSFNFGTIAFDESGLIGAGETDHLDVRAIFGFLDPFIGLRQVVASGIATVGLIGDQAVDYQIEWTPKVVTLANGTSFSMTLGDLSFNKSGQIEDEIATIVLISVPEPTSIALAAAALLGLAAVRRRA